MQTTTVILVYCVAYSFNVGLVQISRANNVSANNVRIAHESMQKNESGGLSLSLLLSKITFNFSLCIYVYAFILNYVKLFLPRSDKLVFGDKRLHQQNCRKTIMVPCLTKHNS